MDARLPMAAVALASVACHSTPGPQPAASEPAPASVVVPPPGPAVASEEPSPPRTPDERCDAGEPGQCRIVGELLYRRAASSQADAQELRDRAHQAFERDCRLRGVSDAFLGHEEPPPEGELTEDAALARAQALREAVEFGLVGHVDLPRAPVRTPPELKAYLERTKTDHAGCLRHFVAIAEERGEGVAVTAAVQIADAPRGQVRVGAIAVSGPLAPEAIGRALSERTSTFSRCYAAALERDASAAGRVAVRLVVDPSGLPYTVGNGGSSTNDPELVRCVLVQAHSVRFPAARSVTTIVAPLVFGH